MKITIYSDAFQEQQIKMVEDAMQQSRMKTYNLEQQVDTLRYSLTNIEKRPKENGLQCDCKAKLFGLQDELQQTRCRFEHNTFIPKSRSRKSKYTSIKSDII